MKKFLLFLLLLPSGYLFSQISEGGLPPSFRNMTKGIADIASYSLETPDTTALLAYDRENPSPMRYAIKKDVSIDIKAEGSKTYLEGFKGNIWRYRIDAKGSKSIQLFFKKYRIPDRAQLFIYNENYSDIRGAFTKLNINEDLSFVVADFPGDHLILEYYEPEDAEFEGEITIGGIGQSYVDIFQQESVNADSYDLINVNCEEGKKWQDQKHAVCKITFTSGSSSYLCTGTLINNTKNDGTPYFLTANHCINTSDEAASIVVYFNYETAGCTTTSIYKAQTLSGSTLLTAGTASDYSLLLLNNPVPASYKPFYAGWDNSGIVTDSTTGIHHPSGKVKKILIDHDPGTIYGSSISWDGGVTSPANSHWEIHFDEGTTYGGSSGSPLFDENKRVIGQLHGGNTSDFYGMLSYSWNHPATAYSTKPLSLFLDPSASKATSLDGYYPLGMLPDPQFSSEYKYECTGSPVEIKGYSAFSPTSWKWLFAPTTVQYSNGTTDESQNPYVIFLVPGQYKASLIAENAAGKDTLTISNIITSGSAISVTAFPSQLKDSCLNDFSGLTLKAYGADSYQWTLSDDSENYFYIENNTTNPASIKLKDGIEPNATVNMNVTLTGIQGACLDAIPVSIPFEAQSNDNISNAIQIFPGKNGPYSNSCASAQTGEPIPPVTSCTGQMSWCDEYGTGTGIVENSVWFFYKPDKDQTITLYSKGFDDQIAVYKAARYEDVLSGNGELVAANDDYTDSDYNPKITNLSVVSGQTYWIQVDGSGGGLSGEFYLYVLILTSVNDVQQTENNLIVYPSPACNDAYIESSAFEGVSPVLMELFNSAGVKIFSFNYTDGDSRIDVPLSDLPSGVYLARVTYNKKKTTVRIIKK